MQETLVLIKPDGVKRKMIGQIITAIESLGLEIEHLELKILTQNEAEHLYSEHANKWHFPRNIAHVTSGNVVVIKVSGTDSIQKCRKMVENYRKANEDVIRLPQNLVHATSEPEKVLEELAAVGITELVS